AGGINPDLAADPPPAQAKRVILAQIGAGLRVDDAIEESKEIGTLRRLASRTGHGHAMHATEMSFGISGNHFLQRAAADQLKAPTSISCRDKIALLLTLRLRAEGSDIREGGLLYAFAALHTALRDEIPID